MSDRGRFQPVLHDAQLGVPAPVVFTKMQLERSGRVELLPWNQGCALAVPDGEPVEVERLEPDASPEPDEIYLVECEGQLRLLRLHDRNDERLGLRPDAERGLTWLHRSELLGRVRLRGGPRAWAWSARHVPWLHRTWADLQHHLRHYPRDARGARHSVVRRYGDEACIRTYVRKASQGLGDDERRLLERASFPSAGRVLVGGCAAGRLSLALAERGHEVVGVDLVPEMIAAARELAAERPELALRYECLNLEDLGPEHGDFDAALFGWFVYGNIPGRARRIRCLRKLAARLPVGAPVVISVRRYRSLAHRLRIDGPTRWLAGGDGERGDFGAYDLDTSFRPIYFYYHFFTRRELARELRHGGFDVVTQEGALALARRADRSP